MAGSKPDDRTRTARMPRGGRTAARPWDADLLASNVDVHADLVRNIPGIRRSQHLFDDLSPEAADWAVAIAAEGSARIATRDAAITRPFDYGTVISYAMHPEHWQATRFSDATSYGVWYGSFEVTTTVYETAWHWSRFVLDSYAGLDRDIVSERRVFDVRCDALLIDLRGREERYPELVDRASYAFCQQVGRYVHAQGQNGLVVRSARCDGTNVAVLRAERLSNVRDKHFLTYRYNPASDRFRAERTHGRAWLELVAGTLG